MYITLGATMYKGQYITGRDRSYERSIYQILDMDRTTPTGKIKFIALKYKDGAGKYACIVADHNKPECFEFLLVDLQDYREATFKEIKDAMMVKSWNEVEEEDTSTPVKKIDPKDLCKCTPGAHTTKLITISKALHFTICTHCKLEVNK